MRTVIATVALLTATATLPAQEKGFTSIFDGQTLKGWDGNPEFWRVEDGAITGQTTKDKMLEANTFIIWREGELADFELKIEYRTNGNSGIQYRSFEVEDKKWVIGGYQADMDNGDDWSGLLYGEKFRNILSKRGEKVVISEDGKREIVGSVGDSQKLQSHIKKEEWNEYHVIAKGNHFSQRINGVLMSELIDKDKIARVSGLLALQLHTGQPMKVQFRNIRVKHLNK